MSCYDCYCNNEHISRKWLTPVCEWNLNDNDLQMTIKYLGRKTCNPPFIKRDMLYEMLNIYPTLYNIL